MKIQMRLDHTPCGKWIVGNHSALPLITVILISWQMPWEWFYAQEGYRTFIEFMRQFTYSIRHLPTSKSQFVEYAQAYIAAINVLGLLYLLLAFRCGMAQWDNKEIFYRNKDVTMGQVVKILIFGLVGLSIAGFGTQVFLGQSDRSMSGYLYESKLAFVAFHLAIWWVVGWIVMGLVSLASLLKEKIRIKQLGD